MYVFRWLISSGQVEGMELTGVSAQKKVDTSFVSVSDREGRILTHDISKLKKSLNSLFSDPCPCTRPDLYLLKASKHFSVCNICQSSLPTFKAKPSLYQPRVVNKYNKKYVWLWLYIPCLLANLMSSSQSLTVYGFLDRTIYKITAQS